ncbi:MAG TPA: efflux RND transporter periplasmic adaptor subunit [Terriglobia bacterium]|nr:efflux RND transporter periplasmic adaptor subunit [Terriglobia bacterium]
MLRKTNRCFSARLVFRSVFLAVLPGLLLLFSFGCSSKGRGNDQQQASAPAPVVVVAAVVQKTVPIYREYVGRTVANFTVEVRPQVTGILETAPFAEGQAVKKGQILFTIDPSEYKAALQSAQAQLAKAEADVAQAQASLLKNQQDVARYAPLVKQQAIPQEQYDDAVAAAAVAEAQVKQAQAGVKGAQAAINQAEINMGYTVIRSPLDGIADRRQVDPGNLVSPGMSTPLVTVSSLTPMRVDFNISETDYLRFVTRNKNPATRKQEAQKVSFGLLLPDGSAYPRQGSFYMAGSAVNAQTGTLLIEAQFPNPQGFLKPGQFCRVRFSTEQTPNAILVPQQAVMELQGAQTVMVVDAEHKVKLHTVTTNGTYGKDSVISQGLQAGQQVIVEGQQKVRPGMTVKPERETSPPGT